MRKRFNNEDMLKVLLEESSKIGVVGKVNEYGLKNNPTFKKHLNDEFIYEVNKTYPNCEIIEKLDFITSLV